VILRSTIVVVALLFAASGCSTIAAKASRKDWGNEYSGTSCDLTLLVYALVFFPIGTLFVPLVLADIPLSLVADTVVLPIDLASENPDIEGGCAMH
jgi:uncharacterized protein YceK